MTENIACDRMVAMLKSQNRIFGNSSDCKVLKVWPTKKRGEIYQALLEVDCATYSGLLGQGSVLVNVDNCVVYDALGLKICFKCCGLNHYAKDCKKSEQICIKCAGNHKFFAEQRDKFEIPADDSKYTRMDIKRTGSDILCMSMKIKRLNEEIPKAEPKTVEAESGVQTEVVAGARTMRLLEFSEQDGQAP
nr:unnamed protein product [Callosobruchus analis]